MGGGLALAADDDDEESHSDDSDGADRVGTGADGGHRDRDPYAAAHDEDEDEDDDAVMVVGGDGGEGRGRRRGGGDEVAGRLLVEPLARRAQHQSCCSLAIPATATVYELKRKLRRALASLGAHPPSMPSARVRTSLSAGRLRLYRRLGTQVGAILRDEQRVATRRLASSMLAADTAAFPGAIGASAAAGSAGGGVGGGVSAVGGGGSSSSSGVGSCSRGAAAWADVEVALHVLSADEQLSEGNLLVGCVTLDAAAAAVSYATVALQASWGVEALLEELAILTSIPRRHLAFAKLTQAGGGAAVLSAAQLGGLRWDDPDCFRAHKLSAPPLALSDGDVLVVRDRHHPRRRPCAPPATPRSTTRRRRGAARRSVTR